MTLFAGHFLSRTEAFYIWCKKAAKTKNKKSNLAESECFCLCRGSAVCRAVTPPVISLTQRRQSDKTGTQRDPLHIKDPLGTYVARASPGKNVFFFFFCSFFSLSSQTECFIC